MSAHGPAPNLWHGGAMVRVDLRTRPEGPGPLPSWAPACAKRLLLALTATLSACTIVNVRDGTGVRTSYYPGVAVIRITPTDSVQVVEVESLGASAVGNSATVGWSHNRVAIVPPGRCQLILWRPRTPELDELRGLLGPGTEICDLGGEGNER